MRYHADNSCVIPNGIDVEQFGPSPKAYFKLRKDLHLGSSAVMIGLLGRYHPVKDHANFLRAAASVVAVKPDSHFLLAGSGVDEKNQELIRLIDEQNLTGRVHLLGEREDTADLMAALDIFALSSFEESCPNVIGEAMACGVPCVVTDVGDAALIIGDTGRVVPSGNSPALATALIELLELGHVGRRALGVTARTRVMELFTLESSVAQYESLYKSMVPQEQAGEISIVDPVDVAGSWEPNLIHGSDNV